MQDMRMLFKWVAYAGTAHALIVIFASTTGLDPIRLFVPFAHLALAAKLFSEAHSGRDFVNTRDETMATTVLVGSMPFGFLWFISLPFFFGALAIFICAGYAALFIMSRGRRETVLDLSSLWRVCSLSAALFAAGTIPSMMGNPWDLDSFSLLSILGVLSACASTSVGFLLLLPEFRQKLPKLRAG